LKAISDGAALVNKTLTAAGYEKLGQIFDLVSSATGFLSESIDDTGKFKPKKWDIYKFVRETTEKVATLVGADKLASFLNTVGLIDDAYDIYLGIQDLVHLDPVDAVADQLKRPGTIVWRNSRTWNLLVLRARLSSANDLVEKINSIFERIDKRTNPDMATAP